MSNLHIEAVAKLADDTLDGVNKAMCATFVLAGKQQHESFASSILTTVLAALVVVHGRERMVDIVNSHVEGFLRLDVDTTLTALPNAGGASNTGGTRPKLHVVQTPKQPSDNKGEPNDARSTDTNSDARNPTVSGD